MKINATHIQGSIFFQSKLDIERVGAIISQRVFAGVPIGGLEKNIYEEVPAVFTEKRFLGFFVAIQEIQKIESDIWEYCLDINNYGSAEYDARAITTFVLDDYMLSLFHKLFEDSTEIFSITKNGVGRNPSK